MQWITRPLVRDLAAVVAVTFVGLIGLGIAHASDCTICDDEVVLDRKLASCFLERYEILQTRQGGALVVDLTDCPDLAETADDNGEQERGVIEALKMPEASVGEPDPTFMITRTQLVCLKSRLENDVIDLDPAAKIVLDDCE